VGTAASMDGYSGFGAPMSKAGVKITMPCPAPAVVIFDLDVAAAAPPNMVASGYGDLSAKIPGGADWILSDAVGLDPIDPLAWELVQSGVSEALSRPDALAAGDADAYEGLVSGLVLSGLAMQVYRGTRPASGAEHYFSHLWELDHLGADWDPPLSHGQKVAIGTLAMTAFYERFLARDLTALDLEAAIARWAPWDEVEADIRRRFTGALADHAVTETKVKYVDGAGLRERLQRFVTNWDTLRPRVAAQLVPARTLQGMLRAAGAPAVPADIGLTAEDVRATFPRAMYYRSRYTVLDLAREAGWFSELVDEVFAPGGLWT
ncbi:MAG: iron-containing alcohol dehydrogenase, partial [Propionicimonas sp.]